jgi:uncharacterized protein with GYD domain
MAQYATLGPYDFVNVVEAPDNVTVARVSAEMASRGRVESPRSTIEIERRRALR